MALSKKEAATLVVKNLERLRISLTKKQITDLTEKGFAEIEGYQCHIANILSDNRMRLRVNKSWFDNADNIDKPFTGKGRHKLEFDIELIPAKDKLYALHYSALRGYALELEKDREYWFEKPRWGIRLNEKEDSFTWEGGNTKKFSLDIVGPAGFSVSLKKKGDETTTIMAVDIEEPTTPGRVHQTVLRVIRDTSISISIKELYNYRCQICGNTLNLNNGKFYAEAHHLKPLGAPHDGPDIAENVLCVCPNHHVLLDFGAIELNINGLHLHTSHPLSQKYIEYHNSIARKN